MRDEPGNPRLPVLKLLARLTAWNVAPNGRHASFFNVWAGKRLRLMVASSPSSPLAG